MWYKIISLILLLLIFPLVILGQNDQFFTLNNVKARPLAMGGAFTSIEDDLAAVNYNPAAYDLYRDKKPHRITFFLNPVSPFIGALKNKDIFKGNGSTIDNFLLSLSLLLKSISVSLSSFEIGILLGEEGLNLHTTFLDEKIFGVSGFQQNHSHSLFGRLKLADKISLGGAANFIFGSTKDKPLERFTEIGISYGILLKPERGLNIGVSFINLPDSLSQFRLPLERIVDESVNIGVSYQLFSGTLISIDVRNLGEEKKRVIRELHIGMEQVLLSHLAIRAGYYKKKKGEYVISWGIGLLDGNKIFNTENALNHRNFYLNYSFVYESSPINTRWHFFSFIIRI
ncbi:MAG: hypothetical protein ACE5JB_09530 [bacterium]